MRPAISDSLISGQPLYLLYSKAGLPPAALATAATGSVRLQVTGKPPTSSGLSAAAARPARTGKAAAARSRRLVSADPVACAGRATGETAEARNMEPELSRTHAAAGLPSRQRRGLRPWRPAKPAPTEPRLTARLRGPWRS